MTIEWRTNAARKRSLSSSRGWPTSSSKMHLVRIVCEWPVTTTRSTRRASKQRVINSRGMPAGARQIKELFQATITIVGVKSIVSDEKVEEKNSQKSPQKKEQNQRNLIEGKFGQGKNAYGLNNIQAKRSDTSQSWIACIFFVMNLVKLEKIAKQYAIFCALFKNWYQSRICTNLLIDHPNSYTKNVLRIEKNPKFRLITP